MEFSITKHQDSSFMCNGYACLRTTISCGFYASLDGYLGEFPRAAAQKRRKYAITFVQLKSFCITKLDLQQLGGP